MLNSKLRKSEKTTVLFHFMSLSGKGKTVQRINTSVVARGLR